MMADDDNETVPRDGADAAAQKTPGVVTRDETAPEAPPADAPQTDAPQTDDTEPGSPETKSADESATPTPESPAAGDEDVPAAAGDDTKPEATSQPESEATPAPEVAAAPQPAPEMAPAPDDPAQTCAAGLFGKLPARGDFISRGIERELLRPLEDWLLPLVQTARGVLGDGWTRAWQQAPAWRFWIGPDVLQGDWRRGLRVHERPGAMTGVLLPSADRQGRHFPLVLVLADAHARLMPPPVLSPPDRQWYAQCDRLLEAARAGRDLAEVETGLGTLRAPRLPDGAAGMGPLLAQRSLWGQGGMQDRGPGGDHDAGDVWTDIRMSDHHLAAAGRSYWWTEGPGRAGAAAPPISVISLAGLPDAETFAFMLTDAIPTPQEPDPT